jgi:hypothetical protein
MSVRTAFERLNKSLDLAPLPLPVFEGENAIAPSRLCIGEGAAVALGLTAALSGEIWHLRGGSRQRCAVAFDAAAATLRSGALLRLDGTPVPPPFCAHPLTDFYQCASGEWLHLHGGFTGENRLLDLINAHNRRSAIVEGVAKWNGYALEDAIVFMNLNGALVRSKAEWAADVPGRALAALPPIVLRKIGEAPPLRLPGGAMPLEALRVIDAGCALSGPLCAGQLAAYGAEVLAVRSPHLSAPAEFALSTDANKRVVVLDLAKPAAAESLRRAARHADIFVDSHRPGALKRFGFTPAALVHNAPGMIYVSISAYGPAGLWAGRRGFEPDVQAATGIAAEQGAWLAERRSLRRMLPALIDADLCAGLAGHLAAVGAAAAVLRRIREGGSWAVSVSLAGAAMWLQSLGSLDAAKVPEAWCEDGLDSYFRTCETGVGVYTILGPVVRMEKTPLLWSPPKPPTPEEEARFTSARKEVHAA